MGYGVLNPTAVLSWLLKKNTKQTLLTNLRRWPNFEQVGIACVHGWQPATYPSARLLQCVSAVSDQLYACCIGLTLQLLSPH